MSSLALPTPSSSFSLSFLLKSPSYAVVCFAHSPSAPKGQRWQSPDSPEQSTLGPSPGFALAPLTKTALIPNLSASTLHGPQTVSSAYLTSLHSCGAQLTRAKRQAQKILSGSWSWTRCEFQDPDCQDPDHACCRVHGMAGHVSSQDCFPDVVLTIVGTRLPK